MLPAQPQGVRRLADLGVPRIHFGVNTGELLGADGRGRRRRRRRRLAHAAVASPARASAPACALQGNLDPAVCLGAVGRVVEAEVRAVLADNGGHPGHVFNLGHGVLPETDPSSSSGSSTSCTAKVTS